MSSSASVIHQVGLEEPMVERPELPDVDFSKAHDRNHPDASTTGVFVIDSTFENSGLPITNLYIKVARLRSEAPLTYHYLLNADEAPGREGSILTIDNDALPGNDGRWNADETLEVSFDIGLMGDGEIIFLVDLFGTVENSGAINGFSQQPLFDRRTESQASQWLGRFTFVYEPEERRAEKSRKIFLPLVHPIR